MATHQYFELPAGTPKDPSLRYDSGNMRMGCESQLNHLNINLSERLDLEDGRRIYRVPDKEKQKLPKDKLGYYLINTENIDGPRIRAVETDPSFNLPVLHDWVNIRS